MSVVCGLCTFPPQETATIYSINSHLQTSGALLHTADPLLQTFVCTRILCWAVYIFPFPQKDPRPSPERVATWPDQAKLLCSGKFLELAVFQDELRNKYGDPNEASDDPPTLPYGAPTVPLAWPLVAALLFVSALIAWWAAHNSTCCTTTSTTTNPDPIYFDTPRGRTTVNLSADLIFDFGKDQPRSPAHAEKLIASLKDLFREFDGIRIVSVAAHTDPIGGTADNVALGQRRAATIRAIIAGLIATPERPDQFGPDPMPPDSVPDGPNKGEAYFWQTCFKQYVLDVKPSFQPLVDLRADKNSDKRVLCSTASETDVFPACARREKPRPQARISYAYVEQAEGLREMTACLAPMRHVAIRFSYKRLIPKEIDATASQ